MTRTAQFAANEADLLEGAIKWGRANASDVKTVEAFRRIEAANNPEAQLEAEIAAETNPYFLNKLNKLAARPGRMVDQKVVDSYFKF